MKFKTNSLPSGVFEQSPCPGEVYAAKGGRGGTKAWVVAAVNGNSVHVLGISEDGSINSTASYNAHAFNERTLIGFCREINNLELNICALRQPLSEPPGDE